MCANSEKPDRVYDPNALDLVERMDASGGEYYIVQIIRRDFQGQTADDYHATVIRGSDRKQLVFIARWRWILEWKTRRKALERSYAWADKHARKMRKVKRIIR